VQSSTKIKTKGNRYNLEYSPTTLAGYLFLQTILFLPILAFFFFFFRKTEAIASKFAHIFQIHITQIPGNEMNSMYSEDQAMMAV